MQDRNKQPNILAKPPKALEVEETDPARAAQL